MSSELARFIEQEKDVLVEEATLLESGQHGRIYAMTACGERIVIKTAREDVNIPALTLNEGKYNEVANEVGVGPSLYYYDDDIVVRAYVEGTSFGDWSEQDDRSLERTRSVLGDIFSQCFALDRRGVHRPELSRPQKDILVKNEGAVIIDFERCRFAEQPSNVLQFAECILRERYAERFGITSGDQRKRELRPVFKAYKETLDETVKDRLVNKLLSFIG